MEEANKDIVEYFQNLDYDVIVKRRRGMFVVIIHELSLIAKDVSLDNAYKKIEMEKEKYFKEMIELDLSKSINEPKGRKGTKALSSDLSRFVAKCAIVLLLIGLVGMVGASGGKHLISSQYILSKVTGFARQISQKIESMPETRKAELKRKLHKSIEQLKPFVDEFKLLWQNPPVEKAGKLSERTQQ